MVAGTTCPPHVHQLNGVAERAIHSIVSLARSYLTGAHLLSAAFWPFAIEMAVDVLNRSTGPTTIDLGGATSFELLLGSRPRVLGIMPFGCRAYTVKPLEQRAKATMDPRSWVGVNLGRSSQSPGGYHIYIPSTGRDVLVSSEVHIPLRPRGERDDDSAPSSPSMAPLSPSPGGVSSAASLVQRFATLSRGRSCSFVKVLLLFSGPYHRPDGLAAFLRQRGLEADLIDCDLEHGGGEQHNTLNDALFTSLLQLTRSEAYRVVFVALPLGGRCSPCRP